MSGSTVQWLAAGGSVHPLVADLGLCLVAAGALTVAFLRFKIPVIAALLCAGVVLGPHGLEAVQDPRNIETISGLGLTLLLFVIGLEVKPASLLASGKTLVLSGALQVPLTLAVGLALFLAVAATGALPGGYAPLYLAIACAFSSTLLVVKYLHDQRQTDSRVGRLCIGLLIFQDVWAIIILALQPSFADPSLAPIGLTFLGTAIVAGVATLLSRVVLPWVFHLAARSPELVVTIALGWCFAVALFGSHLNDISQAAGISAAISVSMEMGALIAGATLATSPFAYEVVARVVPLRDFFVTLFFIGLGMSIPIPRSWEVLALALLIAVVAVALRFLVFMPLLYTTGLDRRASVNSAVKLAQLSEFCLVIVYLGERLGHISGALVSIVILAFVITALATPILFAHSDSLYLALRGLLERVGMRSRGGVAEEDPHAIPRLALLGFHRVGSALFSELERAAPELIADTVIVDINTASHAELRRRGARIVYGDMASTDVLLHANVHRAQVIVSTVPDELLKSVSNETLTRMLRKLAPQALIFANCTRAVDAEKLRDAGADFVFCAPVETAISLTPALRAALAGELASYREALAAERGELHERREAFDLL